MHRPNQSFKSSWISYLEFWIFPVARLKHLARRSLISHHKSNFQYTAAYQIFLCFLLAQKWKAFNAWYFLGIATNKGEGIKAMFTVAKGKVYYNQSLFWLFCDLWFGLCFLLPPTHVHSLFTHSRKCLILSSSRFSRQYRTLSSNHNHIQRSKRLVWNKGKISEDLKIGSPSSITRLLGLWDVYKWLGWE